jgi:hypothetical protein
MMVVFEVHVVPGCDPTTILTQETRNDTQAQVMTRAEAQKVGFGGLPEAPADHEVRYIAVAKRDESRIQRSFESNEAVGLFRKFDVD